MAVAVKQCRNCGRNSTVARNLCHNCYAYQRANDGTMRPIEHEIRRAAFDTFDGVCTNCKKRSAKRGMLCHACYIYQNRHGEPRPQYLIDRQSDEARQRQCRRCAQLARHGKGKCRSCITRNSWQNGKYQHRRIPEHRNGWDKIQERRLRELAGTMPVHLIAEIMTEEFGIKRTVAGIHNRALKLGLSMEPFKTFTCQQVSAITLACEGTVTNWLENGAIEGIKNHDRRGCRWSITEDALEKFLRKYPYLIGRSRTGKKLFGKWRNIIEIEYNRDPWYTLKDAARIFKIPIWTLRKSVYHGILPRLPSEADYAKLGIGSVRQLFIRRSTVLRFLRERGE